MEGRKIREKMKWTFGRQTQRQVEKSSSGTKNCLLYSLIMSLDVESASNYVPEYIMKPGHIHPVRHHAMLAMPFRTQKLLLPHHILIKSNNFPSDQGSTSSRFRFSTYVLSISANLFTNASSSGSLNSRSLTARQGV